MLEFEEFLID